MDAGLIAVGSDSKDTPLGTRLLMSHPVPDAEYAI